jgi:hypothetical protein
LRIQAADDGDVGEAEVAVTDVAPQPGGSLGKVYVRALRDHALGLLDHHAAGQGGGELLVQALGFGGGTMLTVARSANARATMMSALDHGGSA